MPENTSFHQSKITTLYYTPYNRTVQDFIAYSFRKKGKKRKTDYDPDAKPKAFSEDKQEFQKSKKQKGKKQKKHPKLRLILKYEFI